MAILREGVAPNGARFVISDAAYANCTPEEIERRRRRFAMHSLAMALHRFGTHGKGNVELS